MPPKSLMFTRKNWDWVVWSLWHFPYPEYSGRWVLPTALFPAPVFMNKYPAFLNSINLKL